MRIFNGIADAADAARAHLIINAGLLPAHLSTRLGDLTRTGTSPVDLAASFTEAVYANPADFDDDAREIAAGCASICERDGFHGRLDNRAGAMMLALRRAAGETAPSGGWPDAADDPSPKSEWGAPIEEAEGEGA